VSAGDVIVQFGELRIEDVDDLNDALDRANPGQSVVLTVQRGRERVRLNVRLAAGQ
jgi:S1-C subfamily serine protease